MPTIQSVVIKAKTDEMDVEVEIDGDQVRFYVDYSDPEDSGRQSISVERDEAEALLDCYREAAAAMRRNKD